MSSPANRAAAARMSESCCTGTACRRSIVALLATVASSCNLVGGTYGRCVLGEYLIQSRNSFIHMCAMQDVGRQKAQHSVAGAVDDDPAFQHLSYGQLGKIRGVKF